MQSTLEENTITPHNPILTSSLKKSRWNHTETKITPTPKPKLIATCVAYVTCYEDIGSSVLVAAHAYSICENERMNGVYL